MSGLNRVGWSLATVVSLLAVGVLTLGPRTLGLGDVGAWSGNEGDALSERVAETPLDTALGALPMISRSAREASEIRIERVDGQTQRQQAWLTLARDTQGHWNITSLANWPARQDKLKTLLDALAEAQLRARKPSTDKTLIALGLDDGAPILAIVSGTGEMRLQLGDKPDAAPASNGAGVAEPLAGRYMRWLSADDAPVLELSRDIGLPDWRGGLATAHVMNLEALRPASVSRMEISLAARGATGMTAITRGLAPDSAAADALLTALSPLKQNDLRLRSDDDDWQATVTLGLHWPQQQRQDQQLTLAIEAGSKPWARLTLTGSGWPAPLAKRLGAVEIQVNGALREQLIALVAVVEPPEEASMALSDAAIAAALGVVAATLSVAATVPVSSTLPVVDTVLSGDEREVKKAGVKE